MLGSAPDGQSPTASAQTCASFTAVVDATVVVVVVGVDATVVVAAVVAVVKVVVIAPGHELHMIGHWPCNKSPTMIDWHNSGM